MIVGERTHVRNILMGEQTHANIPRGEVVLVSGSALK